jgi:uncharacterized protein YegP (UPF0339 family)
VFNLKAADEQVILTSPDYTSRPSARQGIDSVIDHAGDPANYERRTASDGSPYFVLVASNKLVVGWSGMHSSITAVDTGIRSVMTSAGDADIVDV